MFKSCIIRQDTTASPINKLQFQLKAKPFQVGGNSRNTDLILESELVSFLKLNNWYKSQLILIFKANDELLKGINYFFGGQQILIRNRRKSPKRESKHSKKSKSSTTSRPTKKVKKSKKLKVRNSSYSNNDSSDAERAITYRPPRVTSPLAISEDASDWVDYGITPRSKSKDN